jgi:prolyl oligopeptidase
MKKSTILQAIIICMLMLAQSAMAQFMPPKTVSKPITDIVHGLSITDNYRWLEDKKDPEVISWTKAQNDAAMDFINKNCPPIAGLRDELSAYIDRDIEGPVSLVADRRFFTIKKKGELQPKLFTILNNKNVLLFDPVKIDPSGKSSMSGFAYTEKADKLAVGVQTKGAEISTYYIIDTKTGKQIGKPVEGLSGFTWTKDAKRAYITVRTKEMIEKQIPLKTYLHTLGTDRSTDEFLFAPNDAKRSMYMYDAKYSDVSFISDGDFYSNAVKMKKIGSTEAPVEIYSSTKFRANPYAIGDKIYIYTNDNAPNFKIMVADKAKPQFANWKELYSEKETVLEGYEVTQNNLVILDKKDVMNRIMLYTLDGQFVRQLELPEFGNVSSVNYHRESNTLFVSLTTFTSPTKIYKINASELKTWELFYETKVPVNTKDIEGKIVFYPSKDGTKVPMFILAKKGVTLNGTNPTLLYGYGGFNIGISPSFVGLNASFINRGGVYVIAGIRGGNEYGEKWHENGMLFKKQNCFDDFIAAAEYLIAEKYTSTEKLMIYGGSNGGLLVGAMITQRPDLFKAAICAVPLLDMVRFHKFLIARYWIPEYGDPDKKEDFQNILKYSPYHNIRYGINTPTTMFIAGENDSRVDPLHAKKMVAALQNNPGQINPILLYMDYDSGHGSGKSTQQVIDDQEIKMRYIMNMLEMK